MLKTDSTKKVKSSGIQSFDLKSKVKELKKMSTSTEKNVISKKMEDVSLERRTFSDVDFVAMLMNIRIKMATQKLIRKVKFESPSLNDLMGLILADNTGSSQKIISTLFLKYPGTNFDNVKAKLDYYQALNDRETINHYLKIINDKIKTEVLTTAMSDFYESNDKEKFLRISNDLYDTLSDNIIPFTRLDLMNIKELEADFSTENLIPSSIKKINEISTYKALMKGQLIIVAGKPGGGKTQTLINETYHHAKNGLRVIYLAMGDSLKGDFIVKLAAIHFNIPMEDVIKDIEKYYRDEEFLSIMSNIHLSVVAAGELNSGDVRKIFTQEEFIKTADVLMIDYDSNFQDMEDDHMYSAHDKIYNNMYALCRTEPKKLVYIGSQIKSSYYNSDFPPLDSLAESSRKQAIADYIITISAIQGGKETCGIIFCPKTRRGKPGGYTAYRFSKSGRIEEISMSKYWALRAKIEALEDPEAKLDFNPEQMTEDRRRQKDRGI